MLSMTKVELELILDADMCFFFEKAAVTRTMIFLSLMTQNKSQNILYLDCNYLYGCAKFLPTGGFKWIDPKMFDLNKYKKSIYKDYV